MKYHVPAQTPINKFQKSQTQQSQTERLRSKGERAHLTGAQPGLAQRPGLRTTWARVTAWFARGLGSRDGLGWAQPGLARGLGSRAAWVKRRPRFWWFFFSDLHLLRCSGGFFSPRSHLLSLFCFWVFFFSGCPLMFWSDFILFIRVINRVLDTRFPCNCHVEKYATSDVIRS